METDKTIELNFSPMTAEQEYSLLDEDDQEFPNTKIYLRGLIMEVLDQANLSRDVYNMLYHQLIADIPVAARRFLLEESKGFRFSSYFTWYIQERLNSADALMKNEMAAEAYE